MALSTINLTPKQSGGKGGLLGKILGSVGGGLLGLIGGPAGVAAGASIGGTAGGLIGGAVDPVKSENRQAIAPLERKAMQDPEVQAAQLEEASTMIDATPEITPEEAGPLKDSFRAARERLLAARDAQNKLGGL